MNKIYGKPKSKIVTDHKQITKKKKKTLISISMIIRTLPSTEAKSIAGGEGRNLRYKLAVDIITTRGFVRKSKLALKEEE